MIGCAVVETATSASSSLSIRFRSAERRPLRLLLRCCCWNFFTPLASQFLNPNSALFFLNRLNWLHRRNMLPLIVGFWVPIASHFRLMPLALPLPKYLDSSWRNMWLSLYRQVRDWMLAPGTVPVSNAWGSDTPYARLVSADSCRHWFYFRDLD